MKKNPIESGSALHLVELPNGSTLECPEGTDLRSSLKGHWSQLYSKGARLFHCRGLGTCGTCAIGVEGPTTDPTTIERWRLAFPPHVTGNGLRLACQTKPLGPLKLTKFSGFWGQNFPTKDKAR